VIFFKNNNYPELSEKLIKNERVLAEAEHTSGKIFATNFALLSFDQHELIRIPWELALIGKWNEPLLTISSQASPTAEPVTRSWQIINPGLIPAAVRDRITGAQVFDQLREIPNLGQVRFLARKGPNGVTWTTLLDGNPFFEVSDFDSQTHIKNEILEFKKTLGI
jgi:hypothetical protein